jgi:hypothetical protein
MESPGQVFRPEKRALKRILPSFKFKWLMLRKNASHGLADTVKRLQPEG